MTQVYDSQRPAKPVHIRDFGLPGHEPGATGAVPTDVHGLVSTARRPIASIWPTARTRRRAADRGPREAAQGAEGADRRQPAATRSRPARNADRSTAGTRRSRCSAMASGGIRQGQAGPVARLRDDRERGVPQRVPGGGAQHGVRRRGRHRRQEPVPGLELPGRRGERQFLLARRPLRRAFFEREHAADVLRSRCCSSRGSTPACARSTSAIRTGRGRSATYIPAITADNRQALREDRGTGALQVRRSRPTTSKRTIVAISISSTAPTPACTFWS